MPQAHSHDSHARAASWTLRDLGSIKEIMKTHDFHSTSSERKGYILWIPVPTKLSDDTGRVVRPDACALPCPGMFWTVDQIVPSCASCIKCSLVFLSQWFKVEKNPPKPGLYHHPLQKKKQWFLLPADSSKPTHDCCIISLMRTPSFLKA